MPDTMPAIIRLYLHLAFSQPQTARYRYHDSYLRHFNNGLLSFSSSIHTSTEYIQTFSGPSVINLDAKSIQLLKSEHHKEDWSLCLNSLTDRPTQDVLTILCFERPPASGLARFTLIITNYLDYHHVFSYITTSKNLFVPCSNSEHTTCANTDGMGNCLRQPGQLRNQLHKSMRVYLNPLIKISVP
jgi:hypothetical protein